MVTQLLPISPDGELLARIPGQLVTLVQQGAARLYDDGTLRYTALSDRHPGGIAGWLQPTDPQSIPPNNILGALQNMTSLMVGLQAVNVAVTAVGFAIVINKLTGIEHKLTQLDEKMDQILSEVRLLRVTVAEGFARVEQRFDRKLLAEAMGAVHTVADLLTTGKVLDAGFLHSLYTVETELLGEIQPAMFAGRYAHAAMLIECLANISIAHTLAWLGEEQWQ